jgi:Zn finger protein HypA/HybF involved in hydrogenase expression
MLTRDKDSATKCTICNSWIDKSWHKYWKTVCPTCVIKKMKFDFGDNKK